jgi:hypothetical protein
MTTADENDLPPVDVGDCILASVLDWKAVRNDPDVCAAARQAKKEAEIEDIEAFLDAYVQATGEDLTLGDISESPDAICVRLDGTIVGVEITNVRRSPNEAFWQATLYHRDEMDCEQAVDEIVRLVEQKTRLRPQFKVVDNILVLAVCEADFQLVVSLVQLIPVEDWVDAGFAEIWLADFKGIRDGAHREVRLFGLYPDEYRSLTGRSIYDQKPYG